MNTISINLDVPSEQLKRTLLHTLEVEMEATKSERGEASIEISDTGLLIHIMATDLVATRAITNSILRLLQTSVDVAETIASRD
ncbi:MAG: KEOPS complex subunit Pcc1 [Candidatus Kariarchaeaceae archaeon]|jgi:tRNA threonylcarbamoyladenosine modification (KEOPS) complex  Pcc1 subunit